MSKKEEILANSTSLKDENDNVKTYELNDSEKNELSALIALIDQARLAQDILYTRITQAVAARHDVKNATIEIDIQNIIQNGMDSAILTAKFNQEEEQNESEDPSTETSEETKA